MNVLQNLIELYNQLSPGSTYKEVAKGILANLEEVSEGTIYEVAELTNSSRTTIWRMVQKMGYPSYSEFHHALKQAVGHYTYYNRIIRPDDCTDEEQITSTFIQQMKTIRTLMEKHFTTKKLVAMAEKLYEADEIVFYFPYRTFAISSLQQNLSISGKKTDYYCLVPEMLESAGQISGKSIAFIDTIDHAEAMDMLDVFIRLKASDTHVIKVTKPRPPYDSYTDDILFGFDPAENVSTNMQLTINYFLMLSEIYRCKYINGEK